MISFYNNTTFDPIVITLQGLSAKPGENAIGRFGTGLKYAIAIILRNGGDLRIKRRGKPDITFSASPLTFRNKTVSRVHMHIGSEITELSFTLDYGLNWEPWQALRELYANAIDEGGGAGQEGETVIQVFGSIFEQAWQNRASWYQERGEQITPDLYRVNTSGIFYQGFKVGDFETGEPIGIYVIPGLALSEDRKISAQHQIYTILARTLLHNDFNFSFFKSLKKETQDRIAYWASGLDDAIVARRKEPDYPISLVALTARMLRRKELFEHVELSSSFQRKFEKALSLVKELEPAAQSSDFNFCSYIEDCKGVCLKGSGQIWISLSAFNNGISDLAATLYEEYCHRKYKLEDGRPMQEHFLRVLFSLVENLK